MLRTYWDEFTVKTGIRGFAFVQQTNWLPEKVFWYSLIIVSTGLTISDIYETYVTFISVPSNTVVVVMDNASVSLPHPTLCVPIQVDQMAFINDRFDSSANSEMTFLSQFHQHYPLQNLTNLQDVPLNNSKVSIWVGLVASMLTSVVRAEHGVRLLVQKNETTVEPWGVYSFDRGTHMLEEVVRNVAIFYQNQSVSMRSLMHITGALICRLINVTLVQQHQYTLKVDEQVVTINPCVTSAVSWLGQFPFDHYGFDALCLRLPTALFTFSYPSDSLTISFNLAGLYANGTELPWNGYASLDFTGMEVITPMSQNLLWLTPGDFRCINIQISGHYKQMNQDRRPCGHHLQQKCKLLCRQEYIERVCGCVPLSHVYERESDEDSFSANITCGWIQNPNLVDRLVEQSNIDGFSSSKECELIRRKRTPDKKCSNNCYIACDYHSYSYQILTIRKLPLSLDTSLQIYMDPLRYPLFEEIPSVTPKQLMVRLAGNLSLYLGASLVVLVHVAVFWLKVMFYVAVGKR